MTNKIFAVTLALVSVLQLIQAECPNGCSGAGTCSAKDMCKCFKNYEGNDCSLRTCPFGNAHVDSPKGDLDNNAALDNSLVIISEQFPEGAYEYRNPTAVADEGHFYAECSNRGICGRETGDCACFEGYDGSACQRTSCLNNCNGKGTCESIKEFATDRNGKLFHTSPKTQNDAIYSLWDAKSSYGCKCDPGFFGPDCSLRHCKVGVDPMYEAIRSEVHETIAIYATGSVNANKHFRIRFFDYWGESFITKRIMSGGAFDSSMATSIAAALKALPNGVVDDVTCELEGFTTFLTFLTKVSSHLTIGCQFLKNAGKLRLPEIVSDSDSIDSINYSTEDIKITRTMMVGEDAEPTGLKSALIVKSSDDSAIPTTLTTTVPTLSFELPVSTTNAILLKVDEYYAVATTYTAGTGVFTTVTSLPTLAVTNVNYGPVYYSPTPGYECINVGAVIPGNTNLIFSIAATYNDGANTFPIALGDALFIKHAFYIAIAFDLPSLTVTIDRPYYGTAATAAVGEIYVWPGGIPTTNEMTYVSECSGRGLCDHGSNGENGGVCQCFPGYTNDNCDTQNILAF